MRRLQDQQSLDLWSLYDGNPVKTSLIKIIVRQTRARHHACALIYHVPGSLLSSSKVELILGRNDI